MQTLIFSLFYSQQTRRGAFVPLSSDKVVDEQLTQLFKRTNGVWRYFAKPHSCWPLKGSGEGSTHYLTWYLEGALWSWRLQCGHMGRMFHHTNPRKASWTWKVGDDYWWKLRKENQFDELNHLHDSSFLYFPSSLPWLSSFDPFPSPNVAPYVKWYPLTSFHAQNFLLL